MKFLSVVSTLLVTIVLFFSTNAHAAPVDVDTLDTLKVTSQGPSGLLAWPGVLLKMSRAYNDQPFGEIVTKGTTRVDDTQSFVLDKPITSSLTRIFTNAQGAPMLEHVEVVVDDVAPSLKVTSRSSVRLVEVTLFQPKAERAKPVPIYAYKKDAKHVVFVVAATGQAIEPNTTEESCTKSRAKQCTFGQTTFKDTLVDFVVGPEAPVAQARGDVLYEPTTEKGAPANESLTYVVNASFTETARDPRPVVSVNARTMQTVFLNDGME